MSESTPKNITPLAEEAAKTPFSGSISRICANLKAMTAKMRAYYLRVNQGADVEKDPARRAVNEWLCDNYYVLEKESKQTLKDIRAMAARMGPGEAERIYILFEQVLIRAMPSLTDDTLSKILAAAGKKRNLTEGQFGFVPSAIKAALIRMAYLACFETHREEMIRYAIVGLGKLGALDFDAVIYDCSCVEKILLRDPAGVYPKMDSDSRKYYRHLVACIAAKTRRSEENVATEMLTACQTAGEDSPRRHIGHPILGSKHLRGPRLRRGRAVLTLGVVLPLAGSIAVGFLCGSALAGALCFLPLWEILRTPLWQGALTGVDPDFLPRMDLAKVEEKPKTVVLVSTLLPGVEQIPALRSRLEQLYFSNSDPDMYYCVLADFKEWNLPADEKDDSQVEAASALIRELNRKHHNRFMLFLRARTFNKTQNKYSGWERKRGAITQFIRCLKGGDVPVAAFVGDERVLPQIRYIIALDADTSLLYECAQTLVSAAIHPLNRPVIDEARGIVTQGYGILAPKISPDLQSARATAFSRVMCGCGGVTAYDTRDKDFYQDLFFESIFAGKGLIDVDAFHALLDRRFPENQILSHDILEGAYLRTAYVSDVEMTDTAPSGMGSWLARLHRWLRGDWQNLPFLFRRYRAEGKAWPNPIGGLSRYKLLDNLRRSLNTPICFACLCAALFMPGLPRVILTLAGLLGIVFPSLWAAAFSLVGGGLFTLSRKFFTRTLPHTFELVGQGAYQLIMLPAQTIVTLDAVLRSLWRVFVSRKKLLEWTTAAQSEVRRVTFGSLIRRYWPAEAVGVCYLLLGSPSALSLVGACFALFIPVALFSARPTREENGRLSPAHRETLLSYNAAMWRYYEEFAGAEHHYLPPDNVQQSPVYRVANRTSPTNMGVMLLSFLAAKDFGFIDADGLYLRVERSLSTIEKLGMWHGNLYNWYDTHTLDTLKPEFVSTVDSGNFICCLVALAEGLRELEKEKPEMKHLIARIEAILEQTDLTAFYNPKKKLFSIGYDVDSGRLSGSHYDFLMSEARLTSYYAVARKLVGKKHWGALIRTMSRSGSYAGAVSWTGTMFEYFMPHLLLPVYEGSLLGEALNYCLYCQKKRVARDNLPWGISESAFYAFDNNLNYQYKAHGVQKLGVKRYLDKELVISPYSTFLTVPMAPNSSMENLHRLHELGVYGRYGFYEAVDFTPARVGKGNLNVTRSYMAHHIGMSMVASCNALFGGRMQKRFMRNPYMRSAQEFLQEKIAKSTVVYDHLYTEDKGEKHERPTIREERRAIYPQAPRATLLTNGEITHILTDTGAGYLAFGEADLTRRSTDLLRRPQGVFTLAHMGGVTLSATLAPLYDGGTEHSVEYQNESVTYYGKKGDCEIGVRCLMHPSISCEQRQIAVKNASPRRQTAQVLVYLEPVLSPHRDYAAHPAYSKLFVSARYDPQTATLTFLRRGRDGSRELYLTAGFLEEREFSFETRRENIFSAPNGLGDLRHFHKLPFGGESAGALGIPDACCALRFALSVPAGGQQQATLLLCAARTQAEGIGSIVAMRKAGNLDAKTAARSPLLGDSLEGRLGSAILGQLLFPRADGGNRAAKLENNQGQPGLWCTGISGDLPIALFRFGEQDTATKVDDSLEEQLDGIGKAQEEVDARLLALESYLKLHAMLRSVGISFDLAVLYPKGESREQLLELLGKHSVPNILGARGGVFLLHEENTPRQVLTLLEAAARHTFPTPPEPALAPWRPLAPLPLSADPLPEQPELRVEGGCFLGGRFYLDKHSPLPWCHVLANPTFGTLVSDNALGFTWAVNSRENKLTPWYNDIATDNTGEMLFLRESGNSAENRTYNLIQGARASFSARDARWQGKGAGFASTVEVQVPQKGCAKRITVTLQNKDDRTKKIRLAYYTEPTLGVNREGAGHIAPRLQEGTLVLRNPWNSAMASYGALAAPGEAVFTTARAAFLSGDWQECVQPQDDPCAAAILTLELPPKGEVSATFTLAWGHTARSAFQLARLPHKEERQRENTLGIQTPDGALNAFFNGFLPHQILACRIQGRAAFFQCGGAYGFRDQLQDAMAYRILNPDVLGRQILRCCAVQFEEGDVLHWWHPLPRNGENGGLKGVRTRFSDDLLWLPLGAAEYVAHTGDFGLLDLPVAYLSAPELEPGVQEHYLSPGRSALREDVFSHCVRALERGHNLGEDGLPLIGCGDWCDGFSNVGTQGRGRSVWMALFLSVVLERFAPVCRSRGRDDLARKFLGWAENLRSAVDEHAWDGEWYLRAFYDDGSPMGGRQCQECAIDLLPQSFAVLAGMPDRGRVECAMDHAWERLVDQKLRLVKLFDPPFRHSAQQPGYVKAYPEGIRENGGQYTHSAVWFAMALLEMGRREEGWQILKMLCPTDRATHPELAAKYKLEPYYMPADIYTNPAAAGRGGWSIYTGAASWYLRAVWEELLGIRQEGDRVTIAPKLPPSWEEASARAELSGTELDIRYQKGTAPGLVVDGAPAGHVPLDGKPHRVTVTFV